MNKSLKNSLIISVMMVLPVFHGHSMSGSGKYFNIAKKMVQEIGEGLAQKKWNASVSSVMPAKVNLGQRFTASMPAASEQPIISSSQIKTSKVPGMKTTSPALEKITPSATPIIQTTPGINLSKLRTNASSTVLIRGQEFNVDLQSAAPEDSMQEGQAQEVAPQEPEKMIVTHEPILHEETTPVQEGQIVAVSSAQELALPFEVAPTDKVQVFTVLDEATGEESGVPVVDIIDAAQELLSYNKEVLPESVVAQALGFDIAIKPGQEKMINLGVLLEQLEKNLAPEQVLALQDVVPLIASADSATSSAIVVSKQDTPTIKITNFVTMETLGNILDQAILQQEINPVVPQAEQATKVLQERKSQSLLMPAQQEEEPVVQEEVKPTWKETNRQSVHAEVRPIAIQEKSYAVASQPQIAASESSSLSTARLQLPTSTSMYEQKRGYFSAPAETVATPKRRGRPPKIRTGSALSLQQAQAPQVVEPVEQAATIQLPPELSVPEQAPMQPQEVSLQETSMPSMQQQEAVTAESFEPSTQNDARLEDQRGRKRGAHTIDMPQAEGDMRPEKRAKASAGGSGFGRSGGTAAPRVNGRAAGALPMPTIPGEFEFRPLVPTATRPGEIQAIEELPDIERLQLKDQDVPQVQDLQEQPAPEPRRNQPGEQEVTREQPVRRQENQEDSQPSIGQPKQAPKPLKKEEVPVLPKPVEEKKEPEKEKKKERQTGAPAQIPTKKEKKDKKPKSSPRNEAPASPAAAPAPYQPISYPEYFGDMSGPIRFSPLPPINVAIPKAEKKEPKVNEWQERSPQQSSGHTYVELKTAPSMSPQPTKQSRASRAMRFILPEEQEEIIEEAPAPTTQSYSFADYVKIVVYVVTGITATMSGAYLIRWLILRSRG